jgi:hypoxanthine phosphoribosyltransferase
MPSAANGLYLRLGKVLISSARIQAKVDELAARISRDFQGDEVVLVANLKGSFRFLSDLCSRLRIPVRVDFVSFNSYGASDRPSGRIEVRKDLSLDIKDRNVILVEDIVDTGQTLDAVIDYLGRFKKPRSVRICALLDKVARRTVSVRIDYRGFVIPDEFVVGYGLDYAEYFRELSSITAFRPPARDRKKKTPPRRSR